MRIAIRADASIAMGIGHLQRCLSLAQALRNLKADVRFVTRDLGIQSAKMVSDRGFSQTVTLPAADEPFEPDPAIPHSSWAKVSQDRDADETIRSLEEFGPDWLVVDHYAFDARWHDRVRDALNCRIAVIDDLADRAIHADLLLDHNLAADHGAKYAERIVGKPRILGGTRYALLAPAYAKAPRYEFSRRVRSIGVFMGGSDAPNFSALAVDALVEARFDGPIEIVSTSANPHLESLRERVQGLPNVTLSLDLPDLAAFFARHDLQIGAGGGATWERCFIGVPTLLVIAADNQNIVVPELAGRGIITAVDNPTPQRIAARLTALIDNPAEREELAAKARQTIDGFGAVRVGLSMLNDALSVRKATHEDASCLYEWRNAPENRAMMTNPEELAWDDHVAWLGRVLTDGKRLLLIGHVGKQDVGSIRFDFDENKAAEVSIHLDPRFHGLGLGPKLLTAGETKSGASEFLATVLAENRPSQVLFERGGYERTGAQDWRKIAQ
ncbi:UDP-2,4-diacetamido-2,4,6-trideoxy-beta-L-altropyranose hydrolase [Erythrobacter sp. KY5]|uniref:UDP-2,4-diacetamido-2,4, 6-trideoxy-beta-L-altropyranose hydrolase n=1 Tax=Erythrobacter sp. KY5 TaxID=2011159 RepID=UPI000DBF24ED|nr:UDP-2,4-diacetamido-2,4,6-trideoxy-beta-L-altropyranose hydrolase [Erythrobacter sp. KY5]AWW74149.1 UDP-2,4-diacetamido-2,4,6-trideoxy-beta-L-altropyranose hydrolase [Erythrobacter sp. KY5]